MCALMVITEKRKNKNTMKKNGRESRGDSYLIRNTLSLQGNGCTGRRLFLIPASVFSHPPSYALL